MGAAKVVPSERSKSHLSYYVLTAVIICLLAVLCCYVCYYFVSKIRELTASDAPSATPSTPCPKKAASFYPVQPEVRESATAMATLCRQLPAGPGARLQGDQVFPGARSPAPRPAHAAPRSPAGPGLSGRTDQPAHPTDTADKVHDSLPIAPCITIDAVS